MPRRSRTYHPYPTEAAALLGAHIQAGRKQRGWTESDLAERARISKNTLRNAESGEMSVAMGTMFELARLTGVPLFHADHSRLTGDLHAAQERNALLPQRIREPEEPVDNDF